MPRLIKWTNGGSARWVEDAFTSVADDAEVPAGAVIISLTRFHAEGGRLLDEGRAVGVRVAADEAVESLAYDLPAIALVALEFPKFKDGRAYSAARILRERFGFTGEVRAVGDVLLEQARFMIRCGFDAFEPADGTTPHQWTTAEGRYRHVYQRAADAREPAFVERAGASIVLLPLREKVAPERGSDEGSRRHLILASDKQNPSAASTPHPSGSRPTPSPARGEGRMAS
jgi:uncharacterized protein (DUF934 family)